MIESASLHSSHHHDHAHRHAEGDAHTHHHGEDHHHPPAPPAQLPSFMLSSSAGQRLIAVMPLIAVLWLGIFWAMRGG